MTGGLRRLRGLAAVALVAATAGQGPMAAPLRSGIAVLDPNAMVVRARPMTIGVSTHFGIGGDYGYAEGPSARLIEQIGFDSFRDDLGWRGFERAGGAIPAKLSAFMAATKARPLLILGAVNGDVPGGNPPITPPARAAYARFAARAAKVATARGAMVELGNEWNMNAVRGRPWLRDEGSPDDPRAAANYAPLAGGAARAIRATAPDATVIVGATGVDPGWRWASSVLRRGGGATGAFSAHLYNQCEARPADRTAAQAIGQAEALRRAVGIAAGRGRAPAVYLTEVGWPTATKCVVSREQQADNLAQFLLWSSTQPWIAGVWLYQLKDQGRDPADIEDNFGLVDYGYGPKPAACTVKSAIGLIRGAQASAISQPVPGVYLLQQRTAGGRRLIAWTGEPGRTAMLRIAGATGTARTMCVGAAGAGPAYRIGGRPMVIDLTGTGPLRATIDAG